MGNKCCEKTCTYNTNIPLHFKCPPKCECKSEEIRKWYHISCGTQSSINNKGYIFCEKHRDKQGCSAYFIKNAKFQCTQAKKGDNWFKHESLSDFMFALSSCIKAAEHNLSDKDLHEFIKNLTTEVGKEWYK